MKKKNMWADSPTLMGRTNSHSCQAGLTVQPLMGRTDSLTCLGRAKNLCGLSAHLLWIGPRSRWASIPPPLCIWVKHKARLTSLKWAGQTQVWPGHHCSREQWDANYIPLFACSELHEKDDEQGGFSSVTKGVPISIIG